MSDQDTGGKSWAIIIAAIITAIVGPIVVWYVTSQQAQSKEQTFQATVSALQTQVSSGQQLPQATSPSSSTQPAARPSSPVSRPNVVCNQQGYMPPIPAPPPTGCVLTVEWWYPPNPEPCGLWITYGQVEFQQGVAGYWWYEYDVTVPGHIQAFKQKYDYCEVKDFR